MQEYVSSMQLFFSRISTKRRSLPARSWLCTFFTIASPLALVFPQVILFQPQHCLPALMSAWPACGIDAQKVLFACPKLAQERENRSPGSSCGLQKRGESFCLKRK